MQFMLIGQTGSHYGLKRIPVRDIRVSNCRYRVAAKNEAQEKIGDHVASRQLRLPASSQRNRRAIYCPRYDLFARYTRRVLYITSCKNHYALVPEVAVTTRMKYYDSGRYRPSRPNHGLR